MGQRSVSEIIQQFQPILRIYESDEKLTITSAEEELATKAGENYLSIVFRIRVQGIQGNGSVYKKSFIRKCSLEDEILSKMSRNSVLFQKEAHFYKEILPIIGYIGPRCVYANPKEIILEDLKELGFSIRKARDLLDLEHCLAVVKVLAKLHGESMKMKFQDPEKFKKLTEPLVETVFPEEDSKNSLGSYFDNGLVTATACLERAEKKTSELMGAIDYLNSLKENLVNMMKDIVQSKDNKYWVITHGDSWNNNILFKHDADGRVLEVKLVDYQIVRHCSPAIDVVYFLYTSAKSEVISKHFCEVLSHYYENLKEIICDCKVLKENLNEISIKWLNDELRKYGLLGFMMALLVVHAIFMDEGQAMEVENPEDINIDYSKYITPEKVERISLLAIHFTQQILK